MKFGLFNSRYCE